MINQLNHRLHRVLDDQECDALRANLANGAEDAVEIVVAEPGKGLVEQDQSRLRRESASELHQPQLAICQPAGRRIGAGAKPDPARKLTQRPRFNRMSPISHDERDSGVRGQFVAIVGPNGAGKTTLFKAISGVVPAAAGAITYEGRNLLTIPAHQRMHLGIAHVPEGRQVFAAMTVLENLEMGAYSARGRSVWRRNLDRIFALFPVLAERRSQLAGTLSGGEQQMLAIGRGIASSPQLLLLDEPSMGLAPAIADLIFDRITALHREDGVTLVLVEQRVAEALESCDYGYVLETGRVVLEGTHRTLTADDRVRRAYLGM
jgi:branched-chain amino acid transport system ATP-binding protein